MKKTLLTTALTVSFFLLASPISAQSGDVDRIQTFIMSVIQVLVTLSGLIAAGFFVWGGVGYITSSGNPEALDRSKKTIMYSAIGLTIVLSAFVLSNVVTDLGTAAFGSQ
ncbi:MAG: pilin [Patescibacteria group bacterium]